MAYANKYYDPVKAHEYYMKTRQLKGTSGGMTAEQKEEYNKQKAILDQQKKTKLQKITSKHSLERTTENYKTTVEAQQKNKEISETLKIQKKLFTEQCSARVKEIKEKLKGMTPSQKKLFQARLETQIQSIKDTYAAKKSNVSASASAEKKANTQEASDIKKANSAAHSEKSKAEKASVRDHYKNKLAKVKESIKAGK